MDSNTFRNRTLDFSKAIHGAHIAEGSLDQLQNMKEYSPKYMQWYNHMDEIEKQRVKDFVIRLDKKVKIDQKEKTVKMIYENAFQIMESIVKGIAKIKPNMSGELFRMGSAHNDLKIEQPDEIDFTYQISIEKLFGEKAKVTKFESEKGRLLIYIDFEDENPDISEFNFVGFPSDDPVLEMTLSLNGSKDLDYYKSALTKRDDGYVLNTEAIAYALFNAVDSILPDIELPDSWSHGGFNYPYYSGLRLHIPAFLMQFAYNQPNEQSPLIVSFDFAPVIKLPSYYHVKNTDIVDKYLDRNGFIHLQWQRLERGTFKGGYNSLAEDDWLRTYSSDSIPKVVIRTCKALHNMVKLNVPKYLMRYAAERICEHRTKRDDERYDIQVNDYVTNVVVTSGQVQPPQVPNRAKYATFEDAYENVGRSDYIASYIFKRIVMSLMVLDEHKGRKWTEEDVPDLVVSVYMIVNDLIMSVNQATPVISSYEQKDDTTYTFKLMPRSEVLSYETKEDPNEVLEVVEIPLYHFKEVDILYQRSADKAHCKIASKIYKELHDAIKRGECYGIAALFLREKFCRPPRKPGLDDGIARVISLLKSVSEGAANAYVDILRKHADDDEDEIDLHKILITKDELMAMLTKQ